MEQDPGPPHPTRADRAPRFAVLAEAPISLGIVAANFAVMAWVASRFDDVTSPQTLIAAGALERSLVWSGQWWRLLTAVFLHIGAPHLLANSLFGFTWCRLVERLLGHGRFLAVYLLAGVGASATSLLVHDVLSAGASGALFGMIGASLAIHRRLLPGWKAFLRSRMTLSVLGQLAVWTVLALSIDLPFDHAAHGGGFAIGALVTWLMTRPPPRRAVAWLPLALGFGVLVVATAWPRPGLTAYARGEAAEAALTAAQEAERRGDAAGIAAALERLDALDVHSPGLEFLRASNAFRRGDLESATTLARKLLQQPESRQVHQAAAHLLAQAGYLTYRGEGVPRDAERGYALIKEACDAGLQEACRTERFIRTGEPPP